MSVKNASIDAIRGQTKEQGDVEWNGHREIPAVCNWPEAIPLACCSLNNAWSFLMKPFVVFFFFLLL